MISRLTPAAERALRSALEEASSRGHTYIGSEHLLLGLLAQSESVAARLLSARGIEREAVLSAVIELSGEGAATPLTSADMTPRTRRIIRDSALPLATTDREGLRQDDHTPAPALVGTEHLLYSLLGASDSVAVRILRSLGVSPEELRRDILLCLSGSSESSERPRASDSDYSTWSRGDTTPPRDSDRRTTRERSTRRPTAGDEDPTIPGAPTLSRYGHDLTAAASAGQTDPLIGRAEECDRVIQILSRRQKNNPCLIGEPGVGKTAVVEGLARRIVDGQVPEPLVGRRIVSVDLPGMIAGAKYRGEFEERLGSLLAEVKRDPSIILFIDEIHTIVGAGAAEGAVDAANILKPALARGELRLIGATTLDEYRTHIETDAALERRFQTVIVEEPSEETALAILRGLRPRYEAHHRLTISDDALRAAVALSVRYIPDRHLPDKAIDLMDEAASRVRLSTLVLPSELSKLERELRVVRAQKESAITEQDFERAAALRDTEHTRQSAAERARADWEATRRQSAEDRSVTVTAADIAEVVTQWTGIPVSRLIESELERLSDLEVRLGARVIGQEAAITTVTRAIRRARLGLSDPRRPIGSFLFAGPTGVGKTALAEALAEVLFGSERALIRLDMSEYMESHSIARLIGSPPGYVGHEEGGRLTEAVRRRPYAVVLFDELEKAHPDVFNLLLQVLEDGRLTDAHGRQVDFTHTVLVLTTNLGSDLNAPRTVGFDTLPHTVMNEQRLLTALKKTLRPEFLGRIDAVISFSPLDRPTLRRITEQLVSHTVARAALMGIRLTVTPDIIDRITEEAPTDEGARPLRRAVVRLLEDPLTTALLDRTISIGDAVTAHLDGTDIRFAPIPDPTT